SQIAIMAEWTLTLGRMNHSHTSEAAPARRLKMARTFAVPSPERCSSSECPTRTVPRKPALHTSSPRERAPDLLAHSWGKTYLNGVRPLSLSQCVPQQRQVGRVTVTYQGQGLF